MNKRTAIISIVVIALVVIVKLVVNISSQAGEPQTIESLTAKIEAGEAASKEYSSRAAAYYEERLYDLSVADYTKAIELKPRRAANYFGRAEAYLAQHLYAKAIEDYTTVIERSPRDEAAYYGRAVSYYNLQRQYEAAVKDLTKVVELNPQHRQAYLLRGDIYHDRRADALALLDYTQWLRLSKEKEEVGQEQMYLVYFKRGLTCYRMKEYLKAVTDFERVLEHDPSMIKIHRYLADAYERLAEVAHDETIKLKYSSASRRNKRVYKELISQPKE